MHAQNVLPYPIVFSLKSLCFFSIIKNIKLFPSSLFDAIDPDLYGDFIQAIRQWNLLKGLFLVTCSPTYNPIEGEEGVDSKLIVDVLLPEVSKKFLVARNETVRQFISRVLEKCSSRYTHFRLEPSFYVLKVHGFEEYLFPIDTPMGKFKYITGSTDIVNDYLLRSFDPNKKLIQTRFDNWIPRLVLIKWCDVWQRICASDQQNNSVNNNGNNQTKHIEKLGEQISNFIERHQTKQNKNYLNPKKVSVIRIERSETVERILSEDIVEKDSKLDIQARVYYGMKPVDENVEINPESNQITFHIPSNLLDDRVFLQFLFNGRFGCVSLGSLAEIFDSLPNTSNSTYRLRLSTKQIPFPLSTPFFDSNYSSFSIPLVYSIEFSQNNITQLPLPSLPYVQEIEKFSLVSPTELEANTILSLSNDLQGWNFQVDTNNLQHLPVIWTYREWIKANFPDSGLALLSIAVDSANQEQVGILNDLVDTWAVIPLHHCFFLLGVKNPIISVRRFAVKCMEHHFRSNKNSTPLYSFDNYLLFFVCILRQTALVSGNQFLVKFLCKFCSSNLALSRKLAWLLKAFELKSICNLLYSRLGNIFFDPLLSEDGNTKFWNNLFSIWEANSKPFNQRCADILAKLQTEFNKPLSGVYLPFDPRVGLSKIVVDKCKVIDDKHLPVQLLFQVDDSIKDESRSIYKSVVIYQGGRFEQCVAVQFVKLLDNIWKQHKLDLLVTTFDCTPDGIEEAQPHKSVMQIERESGGGYFNTNCMMDWFSETTERSALQNKFEVFATSLAGYSVICFVLQAWRIYNDEMFITTDGKFCALYSSLWHSRSKFGIKREIVPINLTIGLMRVLGKRESPLFQRFEHLACEAFVLVYKNRHLLWGLANMLCGCVTEDLDNFALDYFEKIFGKADRSEESLREQFKNVLQESIQFHITKLSNSFHILAH
eukprot:TRINITY_DN1106_c0_g2_i2.p1 TRINITY_DN1106_c0_g2~~TRINITY_DN1106_c0_g2_i2.p1  ORF type:complete len:937 (+),score=131.26 TRINITY_DN1106_c0_g2_i2:859-3669(+)